MIKAITFDLWDTIYQDEKQGDEERKNRRLELIKTSIKQAGYVFSEESIHEAVADAARQSQKIWDEQYRTPTAKDRLNMILSTLQIQMDAKDLKILATAIEDVGYEISPPLFNNSKKVLDSLAKQYPLALISDTGQTSGRVLREILKRDGLLSYFQVLTFSDEIGISKPAEKVFYSTLNALKVNENEAVHVGDNFKKDVVGALSIGMRAIHIAAGSNPIHEKNSHYYKVLDIEEIEPIIKGKFIKS
ncbi:HAD family hydrolase [Bacillus cereus]|uniref:HAD family hydrolase n=1 Tax=Bacillus cereus TaxID=1396 RepID=UPI0039801B52